MKNVQLYYYGCNDFNGVCCSLKKFIKNNNNNLIAFIAVIHKHFQYCLLSLKNFLLYGGIICVKFNKNNKNLLSANFSLELVILFFCIWFYLQFIVSIIQYKVYTYVFYIQSGINSKRSVGVSAPLYSMEVYKNWWKRILLAYHSKNAYFPGEGKEKSFILLMLGMTVWVYRNYGTVASLIH